MNDFSNNSTEITLCAKCQYAIPIGTPYYSIVRSLEFLTINSESKEVEIEIVEAEEIIKLCKNCGGYFNKSGLEVVLRNLPIPGQETKN